MPGPNQISIGKRACRFLGWEQAEPLHKAHFARTQAVTWIWPEECISLSACPQDLLQSSDFLEKRQRWCPNTVLQE